VLVFAALAGRLGGGFADAEFRAVFDAHAHHAHRVLRRLGVREAEIDDVLQEVFLVVHRRFREIEPADVGPWVHGICVRKAAEHRRAGRRREAVTTRSEEAALAADVTTGTDPEAQASSSEELARLDRALDTLSDEERAVFVLYEIEELTLKAIAEATSTPLTTVYARLGRARERVARAFSRPDTRRSA
jgi:RNA polymerase sigma-70 factor (ECF subfamily)